MAQNIVNSIISNEDIAKISKIAEKYNMNVVEFGRLLGKSTSEKGVRYHVRFSPDEQMIVDEQANNMGLTRSGFCSLACNKFLKSDAYKNYDYEAFKRMNQPVT
jgi:hypothetical protein